VTRQQKIALDHHCRLAGEAVHPRFASAGPLFSIVLTINSCYE
jgi:hypothetical protein